MATRPRIRILASAAGLAAMLVAASATLATAGDGKPRRGSTLDAKVELGRRLFFDPAASRAGMRSCADCHVPEKAFSDGERTSRDDRGPTRRHSQTLVDGIDNPSAHWDGQFRDVEELVTARLSTTGKKGSGHGLDTSGAVAITGGGTTSGSETGAGLAIEPEPEAAMSGDGGGSYDSTSYSGPDGEIRGPSGAGSPPREAPEPAAPPPPPSVAAPSTSAGSAAGGDPAAKAPAAGASEKPTPQAAPVDRFADDAFGTTAE